ncbi:hypothetical protein ACQJBY_026892 [Aegilops geniculata]
MSYCRRNNGMHRFFLVSFQGTQFTSQTLMWATMGARKQDQLEANLKLILMSIWSSFCLDANTSTCGPPSIDAWRPDIHVSASRVSLLEPIHGEDTWLMAQRSLGDGRIP